MFQYLEDKTETEQENIRRTIQELLRQTCILKTKCDPVTLAVRDNPGYQICNRHREFIGDYLAVMGCELIHEPQEQIFYLSGVDMPTEHLTLFGTKLVLLLKLIYRDKILGSGLEAPVTNLSEIRKYGSDTNLLKSKNTMLEWQEALTVLRLHQLIELPGAVRNMEDETPIYINPTINIFLKTADIAELVRGFSKESGQV